MTDYPTCFGSPKFSCDCPHIPACIQEEEEQDELLELLMWAEEEAWFG